MSYVIRPLKKKLVYKAAYTRFQVPFYLWLIKAILELQKFNKYYEQDCMNNATIVYSLSATKIQEAMNVTF